MLTPCYSLETLYPLFVKKTLPLLFSKEENFWIPSQTLDLSPTVTLIKRSSCMHCTNFIIDAAAVVKPQISSVSNFLEDKQ